MNTLTAPFSAVSGWSNNARGSLWMIAGVVCFGFAGVLVKTLGQTIPTPMIVFFRCLFGLLVIVPMLAQQGFGILRIKKPMWHFYRVLFALVGMSGGFYAVTQLELATAISLSYTRPLFMILLAVLFLGEVIRWRRGIATVIGFAGVLVMADPAAGAFEVAHAAALIAACSVAAALVMVKKITQYDAPASIMMTFSIGSALIAAIPALFFWQMPTPEEWAMLAALGCVASLGQFFWIRAFAIAEATVINPLDYLQLILAAGFGFFLFSEVPGWRTVTGAVVIAGSTLYILFREANLRGGRTDAAASIPTD